MMTNEPYRRLVERSPDGILDQPGRHPGICQPGGRPAVRRGPSPSELVGKPLIDIFHSDGHAARQERLEQVIAGRAVAPFEEQIVGPDGAVTDVEVAAHTARRPRLPRRLDAAIVLTMREISERKRADATLRESEERLTLAFAGAQEGVWDWNLVTGDVVYSPRWKQMLGYADRRDRTARERVGAAAAPRRHAAGAGGERERRARRARVRGRVPAPPQRRPLRPGPLARLSGPARARRPGRAHRRHALRPHRTAAGRSRARAHRAPVAARLCPGGRAPPHRARDARSVRRAADGAQPRHRRAQGRVRRIRRALRPRRGARNRSPGRSIATSTSSSGSSARPRSTTSACAPRSPTTSRTGRGASTSRPSSTPRDSSTIGSRPKPKRRSIASRRRHSPTSRSTPAPSESTSSSSGRPTRSSSSSKTMAWGSMRVRRARRNDGFGLLGMQERAALVGATVEIESTAGKGTTVFLRMAVAPDDRGTRATMAEPDDAAARFSSPTTTSRCGTG